MTLAERPDGPKDVWLCAITHSPPREGETAVKIPPEVAKNLGLDHEQSWIKTDQINRFTWEKNRIPHGISQAKDGEWSFGMIPYGLGEQAFEQVREKVRNRTIKTVKRDEVKPSAPAKDAGEPPAPEKKDWTTKAPDKAREIKPLPPRKPGKDRDR